MKTRYDELEPYTTKDGSRIRELMHPAKHGNHNQSLAEAIVPVGSMTLLHRHRKAEELYHIIQGSGGMVLGDEQFAVRWATPYASCRIPPIRLRTPVQSP